MKYKIGIYSLYFFLFCLGVFYSLSFYKGVFILTNKFYNSIYLEVLIYRLLVATGIAFNIVLGVLITQRFVKNELASPSLLGISQINFIVYAGIFAINKPLFEMIFISNNWKNMLIELSLYAISSFFISYIIVWLAKNLNSKYIVVFGIIINIALSAITLFIMSKMRAPNDEFNKIYGKMMGAFFNITPLFNKKINSTLLICILSNSFGIIGIIWYHLTYWRVEKNLTLIGCFGITNKHRYWTRIKLILVMSIATSMVFILAGTISFVGIAVLLLIRKFVRRNYKITSHSVFVASILMVFVTQITWNYVEPNIMIEIPMGIYVTVFSAIAIIIIFIQRSFYEWVRSK